MTLTDDEQDRIDTLAADWAARLRGDPLSQAERDALERWLDETPTHRAAFEEARLAWDMMGAMAAEARPRPVPRASALYRWRAVASLAACLVVIFGLARFWLGDPYILVMADHRTAPGERASITLSDGSLLELGPESAVDLRFTKEERRIVLLSGLGYFDPAPKGENEQRDFILESGNGASRALGTEFMVRELPGSVEVTVAEDAVEVSLVADRTDQPVLMLETGQSVRYGPDGFDTLVEVDLAQSLAWRRDRLIVSDAPLIELVAELNRYRRGRIVIANDTIAARRISGVFDPSEPSAVIEALKRDMGLQSAALPPFGILLY